MDTTLVEVTPVIKQQTWTNMMAVKCSKHRICLKIYLKTQICKINNVNLANPNNGEHEDTKQEAIVLKMYIYITAELKTLIDKIKTNIIQIRLFRKIKTYEINSTISYIHIHIDIKRLKYSIQTNKHVKKAAGLHISWKRAPQTYFTNDILMHWQK